MYQPIAIIGISFELPEICTWDTLVTSLNKKESFINNLSSDRLKDISNRFGDVEIHKGGYLPKIDLFDPELFGISKRETIKMTPEQRYFLMHALRAFYDAGYTEKHLRKTNTGIFYTTSKSTYELFLDDQTNDFSRLLGMEGTRLANFMDLRGPVLSIDTTCSSSLVALHHACLSLQNRECNQALIGGVRLAATVKQAALNNVVMSKNEACKPFDANADGILNGEGAVFIVIKLLEEAEKDNDPIYGVIKSSALNHGGARIASLTAPNSEAQKEVLLAAWDKANIDPRNIKVIEAHGTGTILGDPIEFEGIQQAFEEKGIVNGTCSISSFKGQIGHLDRISGLAGLLRLVAALQSNTKPIQPNLSQINKLIDESKGIVKVQRETEIWEAGEGIRIGGVSSFGLTGTNAHTVLSNYNKKTEQEETDGLYFIQLGERSEKRLQILKSYLAQYIAKFSALNLSSFSQKINRLYTDNTYREGIIFSTKEILIEKLNQNTQLKEINTNYFLLDLDVLSYSLPQINKIFNENIALKFTWNTLIGEDISPESIQEGTTLNTLFQYVVYKYLLTVSEEQVQIVTRKGQGVLKDLIAEIVTPFDVMNQTTSYTNNTNLFDYDKFINLLKHSYSNNEIVLILFSKEQNDKLAKSGLNVLMIEDFLKKHARFLLYKNLIENGKYPMMPKNTPHLYSSLNLPVYQLERFWPDSKLLKKVALTSSASEETEEAGINMSSENIYAKVKNIWRDILELDTEVTETDDFFFLGGTSLDAIDMFAELEKLFPKTKIQYEEMYEFSTLEQLVSEIQRREFLELSPSNV